MHRSCPHPGVVPLSLELRDLFLLLQQLLSAGIQLLGQCSKLLSNKAKRQRQVKHHTILCNSPRGLRHSDAIKHKAVAGCAEWTVKKKRRMKSNHWIQLLQVFCEASFLCQNSSFALCLGFLQMDTDKKVFAPAELHLQLQPEQTSPLPDPKHTLYSPPAL